PSVHATAWLRLAVAEHGLGANRHPVLAEPPQTIRVEQQHPGLDGGARREQFVVQAETVQRRRHGARQGGAEERHDPLWPITHRDRYSIARLHAEPLPESPG